MAILFTLRVFEVILFVFRFGVWPWTRTLASDLISQHTAYQTTATAKWLILSIIYNRHVYQYNRKKNVKIEHTQLKKFKNNGYFFYHTSNSLLWFNVVYLLRRQEGIEPFIKCALDDSTFALIFERFNTKNIFSIVFGVIGSKIHKQI